MIDLPMKASVINFDKDLRNPSGLNRGVLNLPDGVQLPADDSLILFAEDSLYLHCVLYPSGNYYGVFKSEKPDHLYRFILRENSNG